MSWKRFCLIVFVLYPAIATASIGLVWVVEHWHLFATRPRVTSLATTDFCDKEENDGTSYSEEGCIWQRKNYPKQHPTCGGRYEAPCELHSVFDR